MPTDTRKAATTRREANDRLRRAKWFAEFFIRQTPINILGGPEPLKSEN
jgi:hypothetical protein